MSSAAPAPALLTTYRRGGDPVATPVSLAVAGGRVYFVTMVPETTCVA
jgi:hypothetical protein